MSDHLELNYQLAELPSAQHRAGLAGLVLMIRELKERQPKYIENREGAILEINESNYSATLKLNLEGLKALFDLTFKSFKEERGTTNKIKKYDYTQEEEVEDKKGNIKRQTRYYYSVVVPHGAFLPYLDPSSDDENQGLWIKLWRDMLWNIVRGVPATRHPFNYRCDDQSYSKDAEKLWSELQEPEKVTGQSGNYYLGAMASNAENVPTQDIIKYQFLLNFSPFVFQVYCPATLDKEGKRTFSSYALVIPDVADLKRFCRSFPKVLEKRDSSRLGNFHLPRSAVIDVAEEGAFNFFLLQDRMAKEIGDQKIRKSILGVEVIHAEKSGNSIKFQGIDYVKPIKTIEDKYAQIQDNYWCPWFRKQRLINLLNPEFDPNDSNEPFKETPAWNDFDALLSRIPRRWLEHPYFSHDARILFEQEGEIKMNSDIRGYAEIVYRICQHYVLSKLESKHELKWQECKGNSKKEQDYNNKKYKVANEAFLAVRSRSESKAFIDYFASTLYPYIRKDEFADFAEKLFNDSDEIRSLTLLALSSQFPSTKTSKKESEKEAA
jgi:CRISPR-associated protein Cmx8